MSISLSMNIRCTGLKEIVLPIRVESDHTEEPVKKKCPKNKKHKIGYDDLYCSTCGNKLEIIENKIPKKEDYPTSYTLKSIKEFQEYAEWGFASPFFLENLAGEEVFFELNSEKMPKSWLDAKSVIMNEDIDHDQNSSFIILETEEYSLEEVCRNKRGNGIHHDPSVFLEKALPESIEKARKKMEKVPRVAKLLKALEVYFINVEVEYKLKVR